MYDQFADDYDRFVDWQSRLSIEMPFIETSIRGSIGSIGEISVLDAACGTGMHAIALAKAGLSVCAADLSGEMIARARANAQKTGASIRFEAAGFGALSRTFGTEGFHAALCLGNSLPHLLTDADLAATLADFYACLKPGGVLLIQNRNFDAVMKTRERMMEPQIHVEGAEEWIFYRFYDFNPDGTILFNITRLHRAPNSGWQSDVISTLLKPLLEKELLQALDRTGFRSVRTYGSLTGDAFDLRGSGNLVLLAYK